jgi:hypothetical protein
MLWTSYCDHLDSPLPSANDTILFILVLLVIVCRPPALDPGLDIFNVLAPITVWKTACRHHPG